MSPLWVSRPRGRGRVTWIRSNCRQSVKGTKPTRAILKKTHRLIVKIQPQKVSGRLVVMETMCLFAKKKRRLLSEVDSSRLQWAASRGQLAARANLKRAFPRWERQRVQVRFSGDAARQPIQWAAGVPCSPRAPQAVRERGPRVAPGQPVRQNKIKNLGGASPDTLKWWHWRSQLPWIQKNCPRHFCQRPWVIILSCLLFIHLFNSLFVSLLDS